MDIEAEMERLSREARAKLDADAPRSAGDDAALDDELARLEQEVQRPRAAPPKSELDVEAEREATKLANSGTFPWEKLFLVVGAVVVLAVVWALVKKLLAMLPVLLVVGFLGWLAWKLLGRRKTSDPDLE